MKIKFKTRIASGFSRVWWYRFPEGKIQKIEFGFPVALIEVKRVLREKFNLKKLPGGTIIQTSQIILKTAPPTKTREEFTGLSDWKERAEDQGYRITRTDVDFYQAFQRGKLFGQFNLDELNGWLEIWNP